MDPVTMIAGVGTGIKTCIALFNLCVGLYDLIDRGGSYAKGHSGLATKLDVEKFRLLAFGEVLQIVDTPTPARPTNNITTSIKPETWNLIERVLCSMKEVFDDVKALDKNYGLKEMKAVKSKKATSDLVAASSWTGPFAATFQRYQARILNVQKAASLTTKARWAIHDGDKFKSLVEKLHGWNDDLDNILGSIQKIGLQRLIIEHEFQMMTEEDDLRTIEEVTANDNPTISDAASSRWKALKASSTPNDDNRIALYSISSVSGGSFWTAPSHNIDFLSDHLSSLSTTEDGAALVDMTSQDQRRIAKEPVQQQKIAADQASQSSWQSVETPPDNQQSEEDVLSSTYSLRRITRQLQDVDPQGRLSSSPDISVVPIGDTLFKLLATLQGPSDIPYEGGIFFVRIDAPLDFFPQGRICMSVLGQDWSPSFTMRTILLSICSLLSDPNVDDPFVPEIAAQYIQDRATYEENARAYTKKYATGVRPTEEELELARTRNMEELEF
ncbi:hypothetical protein EG329_010887 [Mollisiaceae sp. DMI_Dod_QoI]|nr:hypothetical protein EG329_010887 [Helotiales sp. DMI_Dod_QoI]